MTAATCQERASTRSWTTSGARARTTRASRIWDTSFTWIIAFIAITSIGAIAVPLNAWWKQDEFTQVIEHCDAKLALVDDKRYDLLSSCLAELNTPVIVARQSKSQSTVITFDGLLAKYAGQTMPQVNTAQDSIATIFYTSGSTGAPKGAVSSHESILTAINTWIMLGASAAAANLAQDIQPSPLTPAALMTVPLFHVTGCHTLFLLSMIAGRKTVMMPYWPTLLKSALRSHKQYILLNLIYLVWRVFVKIRMLKRN